MPAWELALLEKSACALILRQVDAPVAVIALPLSRYYVAAHAAQRHVVTVKVHQVHLKKQRKADQMK
jgi:hypothetical protein